MKKSKLGLSLAILSLALMSGSCAPSLEGITVSADASTIEVGETLQYTATFYPSDASGTVTWSTSNEEVATIDQEGLLTALSVGNVNVIATVGDISGQASLIVTESTDGNDDGGGDVTTTIDWDSLPYSTHEDMENAESNDALKVYGEVLFATTPTEGTINYFIQNGSDGFYVYGQDYTNFPVEVGKVYEIGGFKYIYQQRVYEIVNVAHCVELDQTVEITVPDVSHLNLASIDAIDGYIGTYVQVNGAQLYEKSSLSASSSYSIRLQISEYVFTVYVDTNYLSDDEMTAIYNKINETPIYSSINLKGVMFAYGWGTPTPEILLMQADDFEVTQLSDEGLVAAAANSLTMPYTVLPTETTVDLPTSITGYEQVAITYASTDTTALNPSTGAVTHGTTDTHITLTATLTYNEASTTKTFNINVMSSNDDWLTQVAMLNVDDADPTLSYTESITKSSYNVASGNDVYLGTPAMNWCLEYALIGQSSYDVYNGLFGIRTNTTASGTNPAYIRNSDDFTSTVDVLEFKVAVYGNDSAGQVITLQYSTDSGENFYNLDYSLTNQNRTLTTIRVNLPSGTTNISIQFEPGSTRMRANVDDIYVYSLANA